MAETVNIGQVATIISDEIFEWFKWERRPNENCNFTCLKPEHKKDTHPVDITNLCLLGSNICSNSQYDPKYEIS